MKQCNHLAMSHLNLQSHRGTNMHYYNEMGPVSVSPPPPPPPPVEWSTRHNYLYPSVKEYVYHVYVNPIKLSNLLSSYKPFSSMRVSRVGLGTRLKFNL